MSLGDVITKRLIEYWDEETQTWKTKSIDEPMKKRKVAQG